MGGGVSCNMNPTAPSEHTVTFDTAGGSEIDPVKVKDGETVSIPETAKEGYDFVSWYNGDVEYDFSSAVTSDITLTAKWKEHEYKITYELNGGKNNEKNPATYTINTDDFTIVPPVSGSAETPNFLGWYSDKDLTKPAELTIKKGSKGDLTFYAKWTGDKVYTVTFAYPDVESTVTVKVKEGEALSAEQINQAKAGVPADTDYVGMYTDEERTKEFGTTTKITADTIIYVKVNQIVKYTVTFDSNGGSTVEAATVKDGEKVTKPTDPTKEGYVFKGWFNGETEYDFESAVTTNITLVAKWEVEIPETPTDIPVTKNEDGSYSLKDGTYKAVWEGANPYITFSLPEELDCKEKDSLKLTGTINFGEISGQYKQLYIQTNTKSGTPVFGWNMLGAWDNVGLTGQIKLSASSEIGGEYVKGGDIIKDCKFVFSGFFDGIAEKKPEITVTISDVKLSYVVYDPDSLKPFTISYTAQWAEAGFTVEEDWDSIELKFSEFSDKVHFKIYSDVEGKESYPPITQTSLINFDNIIKDIEGATKITKVIIQAKEADVPDVKISSAIVTKKDGTTKSVVPSPIWGSSVTED